MTTRTKKKPAKKIVAKKQQFVFCNKGDDCIGYDRYASVAATETKIRGHVADYDDGNEIEIWQLVKVVRANVTTKTNVTLTEVKK